MIQFSPGGGFHSAPTLILSMGISTGESVTLMLMGKSEREFAGD